MFVKRAGLGWLVESLHRTCAVSRNASPVLHFKVCKSVLCHGVWGDVRSWQCCSLNTLIVINTIRVAVISRYRTTFERSTSGLPFLLQPVISLSAGNPQHQYVPYGLWCDITSVSCPLANYLVTKPLPSQGIAPPPPPLQYRNSPFSTSIQMYSHSLLVL